MFLYALPGFSFLLEQTLFVASRFFKIIYILKYTIHFDVLVCIYFPVCEDFKNIKWLTIKANRLF